jgi:hypothetical protein
VFEDSTNHFQDNKQLFVVEVDSSTAAHSKQVRACSTHEQLLPPLQHQLQQDPNDLDHANYRHDHHSFHERLQMSQTPKE